MEITILWIGIIAILSIVVWYVGGYMTLGKTKVLARITLKGGNHIDFWTYSEQFKWQYQGEVLTEMSWRSVSPPTIRWIDVSQVSSIVIIKRRRSVWDLF